MMLTTRAAMILFSCCGLAGLPGRAAERLVASVPEIEAAVEEAQPGDVIVMRDGVWEGADILFDAEGAADAPITIRAETPGRVILAGPTRLRIGGKHLVVSGLYFQKAYNDDHLIVFRRYSKQLAQDCRLTECVIEECNHPADAGEFRWISLYGERNRVDHCTIIGRTGKGTTLVAFTNEKPNRHRIDHNYFGPRERLGKNGGETIRIGDSDTSQFSSQTVVEHNCFEACNGEAEIISNKSCDNVYRYNTFLRCSGALTLRHGHGALVEGNFFLGERARGTGGVRIIGSRHRVINNYFAELEGDDARAALSIMNGLPNTPADGYEPVTDAAVAFNTFINCKETLVIGLTEDAQPNAPPANCTIANNLIVTRRRAIDVRHEPVDFQWTGNLVEGDVGADVPGVVEVDDMQMVKRGLLYLMSPNSPALDAAEGEFNEVTTDIAGRPRSGAKDVGCEESSSALAIRGPLRPEDVGASWYQKSR